MPPQFPFAALLLAHDATDADVAALESLARDAATIGATTVVVALPSNVQAPGSTRVVRVKLGGAPVTALRLGMAQLTNTSARAVLLVPLRGAHRPLGSLLALLDGAKRSGDALVALENAGLDESPVLVPRDAWLELVTLGEDGIDAIATRRGVRRVDASVR
jgi:hypothetical protein